MAEKNGRPKRHSDLTLQNALRVVAALALSFFAASMATVLAAAIELLLKAQGPGDVTASVVFGMFSLALVGLCLWGLLRLVRVPSTTDQQDAAAASTDSRPPSDHRKDTLPKSDSAPSDAEAAIGPVINMLTRAEHPIPTLRDFVLNGDGMPGQEALRKLLLPLGIVERTGGVLDDASCMFVTRVLSFWFRLPEDVDSLKRDEFDELMGIEAALGTFVRLRHPEHTDNLADVARVRLRESLGEDPVRSQNPLMGFLTEGMGEDGEYRTRLLFSDAIEHFPTPFRVIYSMRCNVREGVMTIHFVAPRPASFAFAAPDSKGERAALARAHALRLAMALGRIALRTSPSLVRVVANGLDQGSRDVLLSVSLTRQSLERIEPLAFDPRIEWGRGEGGAFDLALDDLLGDPSVNARVGADGWFEPVTAFALMDDASTNPRSRFFPPEVSSADASTRLANACNVRRVSDLGINENAARAHAWNANCRSLGGSTEKTVQRLVRMREEARDITVIEACTRVSQALVDGDIDPNDLTAMRNLFVDGTALGRTVQKASKMLAAGKLDPDTAGKAAAMLESELEPLMQTGLYLDDTVSVYRYFNSIAERLTYNKRFGGDERRVRLVPDEYYVAHARLVTCYRTLGRPDDALREVEVLEAMAPVTTDVVLMKVRVLEELSRVAEAAEALCRAIEETSTQREMAICFYRLAYMEWQLGHSKATVACYERALSIASPSDSLHDIINDELEELLDTEEDLSHMTREQVFEVLRDSGIPEGDTLRINTMLRDCLMATTDEGIFLISHAVAAMIQDNSRNDTLYAVMRSLSKPEG